MIGLDGGRLTGSVFCFPIYFMYVFPSLWYVFVIYIVASFFLWFLQRLNLHYVLFLNPLELSHMFVNISESSAV